MKPSLAPPKVLAAGVIAFTAALASYLLYLAIHPPDWTVHPVDLHIYVAGGLIVRHVPPFYRPHLAAPLYGWTDPGLGLKFTYPPFAALVFAAVSLIPGGAPPIPRGALAGLSVGANFALLLAALWFTLGGLGCREPRARAGGALLTAAAVLWTEPFLRTRWRPRHLADRHPPALRGRCLHRVAHRLHRRALAVTATRSEPAKARRWVRPIRPAPISPSRKDGGMSDSPLRKKFTVVLLFLGRPREPLREDSSSAGSVSQNGCRPGPPG